MKNSSVLVKEIRCNRSTVFLMLGDNWYKYTMPSGVLGDMLMSASLGKYYNMNVRGNFGEQRVADSSVARAKARVLYTCADLR